LCVKKNHENTNTKIQQNLEDKKKYMARVEIGPIIEYYEQKLSLRIFVP
jgi:predicted metal-dependent hydrolase